MTRIISQPDSASAPRISRESVANFFKQRAQKADQLGHIQAVIYQDKKNTYWFGSWQTGVYRYDR
jgi:hypothetical protein